MSYEFHWESRGVHKVFTGFLTTHDFLKSAEEIHGSKQFDDLNYVINDFSGITGHGLNDDTFELYGVMTRVSTKSTKRTVRSIFVTADERLMNLINAHLAKHARYYQFLTCPDLGSARAWLLKNGLA